MGLLYLTKEEMDTIWNGLAAAKLAFEEHGNKERMEKVAQLFALITYADKVGIEIKKDGLTEEGMKDLQELLEQRKKGGAKEDNVIKFPG